MYSKIMIPVDLAHADQLGKAITAACDLAKHYKAELSAVGVTSSSPSSVAHNPKEFSEKLAAFCRKQSEKHGTTIMPVTEHANDPTVELNVALEQAAEKTGADLIVMASHVPGIVEHVLASNAGYFASHTKLSVFIVR